MPRRGRRIGKKEWLAWNKWGMQEPGLFKLEFEDIRGITLCNNCYFMEHEEGKVNEKGVQSAKTN